MKYHFRALVMMVLCLGINLSNTNAQEKLKAVIKEGTPQEREAYELNKLINPQTGKIPDNIRHKELKFARKVSRKTRKLQRAEKNNTFTHRGPFNVGGRTRALALDIDNEDIILAAGISGGLWRSTNDGSTWTRVSDLGEVQNVASIVQDPRAGFRNIWYYGTGELIGNSARASGAPLRGNGIYKSINGGVTWTPLVITNSPPETFNSPFQYNWRLAIHPTTGDLYTANLGGIYRSTDGGTSFQAVIDAPGVSFTDIQISDNGVLYATIGSEADSNSGIWRSTTGNVGEWTNIGDSFTDLPNNYRRIVIGIDPSDDDKVFFLANASGSSAGVKTIVTDADNNSTNFIGLWRYEHNVGWQNRSENLPGNADDTDNPFVDPIGALNTQTTYNMLVKVHPNDSTVVYVGGTNLYRSDDGFASDSLRNWVAGYSTVNNVSLYLNHHPDQHELVFYPSNPNRMLSGHDGGLSRTENNLATDPDITPVNWTSLNSGYLTTQSYAIAIDPVTAGSDLLLSGFQDNSTWRTTSANSEDPWEDVFSGDGAYCAIAEQGRRQYYSSQRGRVAQFNFDANGNFLNARLANPLNLLPDNLNVLFINPFILDPNQDQIMYYLADNRIYRNVDLTAADLVWDEMSNTITSDGRGITALAVSTNNPANRLYYGTSNGRIFRLDNANTSDERVQEISFRGQRGNVISIAVDPFIADKVIVAFSNYGIRSIFMTNDGGETWEDISNNLEDNADGSGSGPSIRWITILGDSYYAATSTGLYRADASLAGDLTWVPQAENVIGNVVIDMMQPRLADSSLYVGTHGNGIYSTTVDVPCKSVPTVGPSNVRTQIVNVNDISVAFDQGDGDYHLVLLKEGSDFVAADLPVDGQTYDGSLEFGAGTRIGDAFVVHNGALDSIVVTSINENIDYFVTVITYNCSSSPQYLSSSRADGQFSISCAIPTTGASDISISSAELSVLQLGWTAGDGVSRLVLLKEGGDFVAADLPVDGESYTANVSFGQGDQIGDAFVVANTETLTEVLVQDITPGNEYCVAVIEFSCNNTLYLRDNLQTMCLVTTSVEDNLLKAALSIFPNPSQEYINVQLEGVQYTEADLTLYSSQGKIISEKHIKRESADFQSKLEISGLSKGVYFLKIKTENAQSIQRVVID